MSKSVRLRLQDVRDVFHLIGECRDLGCDPRAWRTHLLAGLCGIVGAQLGIGGLECWTEAREDVPRDPVSVGWPSESSLRHFAQFVCNVNYRVEDPLAVGLTRLRGAEEHIVRRREQLIGDGPWYGSAYFNEHRKPCDVDDCIESLVELPGSLCDLLTVHRVVNDRPFGGREREVVLFCHCEVTPLLGRVLKLNGPSADQLSPRLRDVLVRLLNGDGEKQVARALGLTVATAHQYVKHLYRHYGANSRGELMALFVRLPIPRNGIGGVA